MAWNYLMTHWRRIGAAMLAPILCAFPAAAQPAISSVSGTVTHGSTIVISGSGFGTKANPVPLIWETFADGSLNPLLADHGGMFYGNGDNLRHAFSGFNARADFGVNGDGHYFSYEGATAPKWFVQYWVKPAANWRWGTSTFGGPDMNVANVKVFRMYPRGGRNYSNIGYSVHGFENGNLLRFVENGTQTYLGVDARPLFTPDVWHNVQVEFAENTGPDQNDGTMRLWVDGVLRDSTTTLNTNASADGPAVNKRPYVIGWYNSWADAAPGTTMYAYYTDIYIDNTWARIELGNASTYDASTRREIQYPTGWSDSSVLVQLSQGAFLTGQTAYLYVVDSSGRVNTNGFPLVIGGGQPASPLTAPTGLHIVD